MSAPQGGDYHERQFLLQCGRHALNNLVGEAWLSTENLCAIAADLRAKHEIEDGVSSFFNPYHHWAGPGVGNWDVMVLIEALKLRGLRVSLHIIANPHRPESTAADLETLRAAIGEDREVGSSLTTESHLDDLTGVIVNEPGSRHFLLKHFSGTHWLALTRRRALVGGVHDVVWVDCDSKFPRPRLVAPHALPSHQKYCEGKPPRAGSRDALVASIEARVAAGAQAFLVTRSKADGAEPASRSDSTREAAGGGSVPEARDCCGSASGVGSMVLLEPFM